MQGQIERPWATRPSGSEVPWGYGAAVRSGRRILVLLRLAVLVAVLGVVLGSVRSAVAQTTSSASRPVLRVAVWPVAPFVEVGREGEYGGFSIELLEDIAAEADFDIEYVEVESVLAQLDAVRDGRADLAISAISITSEREEYVDFSVSMFESGIQAMVASSSSHISLGAIASGIFSPILLLVFGLMVAGTLATGVFVWAWERRRGNDHFANRGITGAFDGIWWATVTLFTIGYGDKVPHHVVSRVVTILWMFLGVLLVATITAEVTSAVTIERLDAQISSIDDLDGRDVITYPGTTSWDYLLEHGFQPRPVDSIDDAYEQVRDGRAHAFVFDASIIQWLVAQRSGVEVAGPIIRPENYGIVLAQGSQYTEMIDRALLRLREDGDYERLKQWYFG